MPFAFTELGVAMLSSVLRSETAIEINCGIMRAFVTIRQMIADNSPLNRLSTLEKNLNELKQDLEEIFADYNDINEDTRASIDAINTSLAELQSKSVNTLRRPVGFSYKKSSLKKELLYTHGESNPNRRNRNPLFYPLNYGNILNGFHVQKYESFCSFAN